MAARIAYCEECGARLDLYVVGICTRCHFDLTGEDEERDARERRWDTVGGSESPREGSEA